MVLGARLTKGGGLRGGRHLNDVCPNLGIGGGRLESGDVRFRRLKAGCGAGEG